MKNKKCWDKKVNKKEAFHKKDWVLIWMKKSKKFEVHWYGLYQIIQSKILNTYLIKAPGKSHNKYLISGDRMRKVCVESILICEWCISRGSERPKKTTEEVYNARLSEHTV